MTTHQHIGPRGSVTCDLDHPADAQNDIIPRTDPRAEVEARPDWAARRAALPERYRAVAEALGKPMTPFELDGAVGRDSRPYEPNHPCAAAIYDRRGLLNVLAAILARPAPPSEGLDADRTPVESWRDPELLDALRNGKPIGANGRARILEWYAALAQPEPREAALREALEALPVTMGYMDGDDEQRDELTVLVSKDQVLAALPREAGLDVELLRGDRLLLAVEAAIANIQHNRVSAAIAGLRVARDLARLASTDPSAD